jgi:hypothetical protein
MDGTIVSDAIAVVKPPVEHRQHAFHRLIMDGQSAAWHWSQKLGVWDKAGRQYQPAAMAENGWRYGSAIVPEERMPAPPPAIPAGFETMTNVYGEEVRAALVPGRRRLEDQTVRSLIAQARATQAALIAFKRAAFDDIRTFQDILSATYGARGSGTRGIRLESFDGLMRVEVSSASNVRFGAELDAAKALIEECVKDWLAEGSNAYIHAIVMDAFKVGEAGAYSAERVLRLQQFDIPDERWRRAMTAIQDARRAAESKLYVRFYVRENAESDFVQIVLDASRV